MSQALSVSFINISWSSGTGLLLFWGVYQNFDVLNRNDLEFQPLCQVFRAKGLKWIFFNYFVSRKTLTIFSTKKNKILNYSMFFRFIKKRLKRVYQSRYIAFCSSKKNLPVFSSITIWLTSHERPQVLQSDTKKKIIKPPQPFSQFASYRNEPDL